jgi:hypothetical protein
MGVHPWSASPCKITIQDLSTHPWQVSASQETTGDEEQQDNCLAVVNPGSMAEIWNINSPMAQTECFPHQLFHCNILSLLVCICCCSSHPSLCHRFERNGTHWLDLLALFYLFWEGYLITVCYWYGLSSWSQNPHPVTYVCILLRQKMLSLGLYFSILTIPVQALPSGHAFTITLPI